MADAPVDSTTALANAARLAGLAPSILNTQPWRWRIRPGVAELYADRSRQLAVIDASGRLLTVSCGAALHHARVALAIAGHQAAVARLPAPACPDLLARVKVAGSRPVHIDDLAQGRAMRHRRTDRRPFVATQPVPDQTLRAMRLAAEAEGARLQVVRADQVEPLAAATRLAQAHQAADDAYLAELRRWTPHSHATGAGVGRETIVAGTERPVPVRDLAPEGEIMLHPGPGDDRFASYLILATAGDAQADWLSAGEALSAAWLTAATHGLAVSPISDAVEVDAARAGVGALLECPGHPQLVLRIGLDLQPVPPPASPRRRPDDVVEMPPAQGGQAPAAGS